MAVAAAAPAYSGIKGLTPRDPIGAVLRVGGSRAQAFRGKKGPDAFAYEIVNFRANDAGERERHPRYARYNKARPEARQDLEVVLVHATVSRAYNAHLELYRVKNVPTPHGTPFCHGDGVNATRWINNEAQRIPCPNDQCRYRRAGSKEKCKPSVTLLFQPVWPETVVVAGETQPHPYAGLPTPLMLFESGSWKTAAAFAGFWASIDEQYELLGVPVEKRTIYGLRAMLSVRKERSTDETGKTKFVHPVTRASLLTPDVQRHILERTAASNELHARLETIEALPLAHTNEARHQRYLELSPSTTEVTPPTRGATRPPVDGWADANDPTDPRPLRPEDR